MQRARSAAQEKIPTSARELGIAAETALGVVMDIGWVRDRAARCFSKAHPTVALAYRLLSGSDTESAAVIFLEEFRAQGQNGTLPFFSFVEELADLGIDAESGCAGRFWLPWEGGPAPSHKTKLFGGVTLQYARAEAERTLNLIASMCLQGYRHQSFESGIRGYFLSSERGLRFVLKGGHHRVALLKALGVGMVNVHWDKRFAMVITEDGARDWPQVANGRCSQIIAQKSFHRFYGD